MKKKILIFSLIVFMISCSPPAIYEHTAIKLGLNPDCTGQSWEVVSKNLSENNFKIVKPKIGVFRMLNWKAQGLEIWVAYKGLGRYVKTSCRTSTARSRIFCDKFYLRKYLIAKFGVDKDGIVRKMSYDFEMKDMGFDYMGQPFIFNPNEWGKSY